MYISHHPPDIQSQRIEQSSRSVYEIHDIALSVDVTINAVPVSVEISGNAGPQVTYV